MLPSACSFILDGLTFSFCCSTLHVSAYMAIFMCVWCFTFIFLKEFASLLLLPLLHVVILRSFSFVFFCCCGFVSFLMIPTLLSTFLPFINIKWVHQYATIYISCSSSTTCFGSMQARYFLPLSGDSNIFAHLAAAPGRRIVSANFQQHKTSR
jgi:hypothetical protein